MLNIKIKCKNLGFYNDNKELEIILESKDKNIVLNDLLKYKDSKIGDIFSSDYLLNHSDYIKNLILKNNLTMEDLLNSHILIRFIENCVNSIEIEEKYIFTNDELFDNGETKDFISFMKLSIDNNVYTSTYETSKLIELIEEYKQNKENLYKFKLNNK